MAEDDIDDIMNEMDDKNLKLGGDELNDSAYEQRERRRERKVNRAIFAAFWDGSVKGTQAKLAAAGFNVSERTVWRYKAMPEFADDIQKIVQQQNGVLDNNAIRKLLSATAMSGENDFIRLRALELLGKSQELFVERVKHEGNVVLSIRELLKKAETNGTNS